jgi:AraC-like DNA-binding protein
MIIENESESWLDSDKKTSPSQYIHLPKPDLKYILTEITYLHQPDFQKQEFIKLTGGDTYIIINLLPVKVGIAPLNASSECWEYTNYSISLLSNFNRGFRISLESQHLESIIIRLKGPAFYRITAIPKNVLPQETNFNLFDVDPSLAGKLLHLIETNKSKKPAQVLPQLEKVIQWRAQYTEPVIMDEIYDCIVSHKGNLKVKELSSLFRISYKTMERLFAVYLGFNPKAFINKIRFNYACHDLMVNSEKNLFETIVKYGYYDQNHLIKDFKFYLNATPGQLKFDETIVIHL